MSLQTEYNLNKGIGAYELLEYLQENLPFDDIQKLEIYNCFSDFKLKKQNYFKI